MKNEELYKEAQLNDEKLDKVSGGAEDHNIFLNSTGDQKDERKERRPVIQVEAR